MVEHVPFNLDIGMGFFEPVDQFLECLLGGWVRRIGVDDNRASES